MRSIPFKFENQVRLHCQEQSLGVAENVATHSVSMQTAPREEKIQVATGKEVMKGRSRSRKGWRPRSEEQQKYLKVGIHSRREDIVYD
jgi:hypothetical protein